MDRIKEQEYLNSIRNEMSHLWGSVFIIGGGAIGLFLLEPNIVRYCLGIVGIIVAGLFFNIYFYRRQEMFKIIEKMEDE